MTTEPESEVAALRQELAAAVEEIASLRIRTVTTLSGVDFITIIMIFPMMVAFVILGIIVIWKTTSNPAAVGPHLDVILLALSIFANPTSAALGAITGRYSEQKRNGEGK